MRIDLVGTTADFRRFGHPQTLPINHLLCENRRTQGRMGEVGLGVLGRLKPCSPSLRPLSMPVGLSPSPASMQTGWWYCPIRVSPFMRSNECSRRHQPPQLLLRGLAVLLLRSFTPVFEP